MSRRSARLVSGGYYNSDEESDSSSVTNISYRESPVRVFKKKAGGRKAASRTSSRANSNASSVSTELPVTPDQYDGLSPALQSSPTQHSMRTVPYTPTTATPRPALTPTSARSQTPTSCPLAPPEKSSVAGLCGSSRPGCLIRPRHKELNQSGVDSSGYSSSEGHYRKPTAITSAASGISSIHGAPVKGRRGSGSPSQMSSISSVAAAVKSRIMTLADQANASLSSRTKKTAGLLLLVLLIIILCIWFLLPLLTSLFSRMTVTRTPTPTKPKSQPVSPVIPPAHPNTVHPVVDPAVVSAAVEEKMHRLLGELLLKQESLISQMEERLQLDMQGVRTRLEAADSDSRLRLEKEVAGLGRQMADYQRDSRSAATDLDLRIQAVEAQNAKLSRELSSVQMRPPPAPCPNPDPVTAPVHNLLTPELQQAMEKWLSDRIKQQDAIRLSGKESCSDCGRPMADKMADFALETQGASVVSTRCSETYRIRSACVTLFGFPLWYPSESPRTVIQGYPVLLPGKCWAFHGVQGTLLISLSHPIRVTHVTLDHLPRYNSPTGRIDSAPKDFEVYGMVNDTEEGTLLGKFTYNQDGESTQTFKLPSPSDVVYRFVELRILSNWGHVEYTCVYRFRVHGKIAST